MSVTKLYVLLLLVTWSGVAFSRAAGLAAAEISALQSASQGDVVILNDLWSQQRELPTAPVTITANRGPQLLLSDKPEYFYTGNGIALQEDVQPGVVRLYVYHVPQPTNGPKTISAVLENLGKRPLVFRFLHRAFPKPGKNYHLIGKLGLIGFFNSHRESATRRVPPGGRLIIDPDMDAATVTTDELVHGFYEFEISQPARITTFERDPAQSSLTVIDQLPQIPYVLPGRSGNGAGRGLFLTNDFNVVNEPHAIVDTAQGPQRLVLADGRQDRAMIGHDGISQMASARDSGNYGAMYHLRLKRSSSAGRRLALFMTKPAAGGKWCRTQAAAVQVTAGAWPAGTVAIPAHRVDYGAPGEMVLLQENFRRCAKARPPPSEILYSPPGASCMPTPFLSSCRTKSFRGLGWLAAPSPPAY